MVDSVDFAKYIINRAISLNETQEEKIALGETKLHKLLYICDGFLLVAGMNFIKEQAKAWNYGPVYPRIHTWLQKEPDAFTKKYEITPDALIEVDIRPLVDEVLNTYGRWTANELSNWSHSPDSPWEVALKKGKGVMNSVIDKNDMEKHFRKIISDAE